MNERMVGWIDGCVVDWMDGKYFRNNKCVGSTRLD
jgi:hypothetical protein